MAKITLTLPTISGGGGSDNTNLSYISSPTQGTVTSDTGTSAIIPLADITNAGLLSSLEKLNISTALQSGDNISELINDNNYITLVDIPAFVASDYDLEDFTNIGADPFAHISDITSGITNLSYTASPTNGVVTSDTGDDATIPLADNTNAGLLSSAEKAYIATALQPSDISGKVPYTGATSNVDLGEYQLKAGQLELDQTPTGTFSTGKIRWNDTAGTAEIRLKGNSVTLQLGQELVKRVVNKTATNITLQESNYQVVRIIGATGQRLSVDLAQADSEANSKSTLGLVTENIANNQEGFITFSGEVNSINTTGSLQGETWADGDVLYLSPTVAGGLTNIAPTAPDHTVRIGYVQYAHITQGKIHVDVDTGYSLENLHNVKITATTAGKILGSTTEGLWENKSVAEILGNIPATSVTVSPVGTIASTNVQGALQELDAEKQNTLTNPITGVGSTDYIPIFTASGTLGNSQIIKIAEGYKFLTLPFRELMFKEALGSYGIKSVAPDDNEFNRPVYLSGSNIQFFTGETNSTTVSQKAFFSKNGNLIINEFVDNGIDKLQVNGSISATNYTGSATLTGTPTAPTATAGTNTTQIATTAFVQSEKNLIAHWTKIGVDISNNNSGNVITNGNLYSLGYGFYANRVISGAIGFDTVNTNSINFGATTTQFIRNGSYFGISGTQTAIDTPILYNPTSGTGGFNTFALSPTINQTGGSNGITRGLYINPTLTSAADFRAIEVTAGKVIIPAGASSNEAVNKGQLDSATSDFLLYSMSF